MQTIRELVGIFYLEMPWEIHEQMALEQFVNTLNRPRLQEHFLAIRLENITEAVTAGNELLQVRQSQLRATQLELEEETVQAPSPFIALVFIAYQLLLGQLYLSNLWQHNLPQCSPPQCLDNHSLPYQLNLGLGISCQQEACLVLWQL